MVAIISDTAISGADVSDCTVIPTGGTQQTLAALLAGGSGTSTLIISGTITTSDATPTLLPDLPTMANQRSVIRVTGAVAAQNTISGDSSFWDITVALKRTGAGVSPVLVGDPSSTVYGQDASLAAAAVSPSAGAAGPSITVTGVAGSSIEWAYTLTVVTSD